SLGLDAAPSIVLATTSRMPTVAEQDRLQAALGNTIGVYVERGPRPRSDTRTLLLLAVVAGVIALGAAAIANGLAAADRPHRPRTPAAARHPVSPRGCPPPTPAPPSAPSPPSAPPPASGAGCR